MGPQRLLALVGAAIIKRNNEPDESQILKTDNNNDIQISNDESGLCTKIGNYSRKYRRDTRTLLLDEMDGGNYGLTRDKNNDYTVFFSKGETYGPEETSRDFLRLKAETDEIAEKLPEPGIAEGVHRIIRDRKNENGYDGSLRECGDTIGKERYHRRIIDAGDPIQDVKIPREMAGGNQRLIETRSNELGYRSRKTRSDILKMERYYHKYRTDVGDSVNEVQKHGEIASENQRVERHKNKKLGLATDYITYKNQTEKRHEYNKTGYHIARGENEDTKGKRKHHHHQTTFSRDATDVPKYFEKPVRSVESKYHSPRREDTHGRSTHSRTFRRDANEVTQDYEKSARHRNNEPEHYISRAENEGTHRRFIHDHGYRREVNDTTQDFEDHEWMAGRSQRKKRHKHYEPVHHISRAQHEDFQRKFIHIHGCRKDRDDNTEDIEGPEWITVKNQKKKRHKHYETRHQISRKERDAKRKLISSLEGDTNNLAKYAKGLELLSAAKEIVQQNTYDKTKYYFPGVDSEVILNIPYKTSEKRKMYIDSIGQRGAKKKEKEITKDNEIRIQFSRDENGGTVTYSRKLNGNDVDKRNRRQDLNEEIGIHVSPLIDGKGTITYFRK